MFLLVAEPCELYCADADDTVIVPWGDTVMDGTPCNVGTRDMCISGICRVRKIYKVLNTAIFNIYELLEFNCIIENISKLLCNSLLDPV
jgi:hypothetical protein